MLDDNPTAYIWETKRGRYLVEADEDFLFFRALRALRTAHTVEQVREVDENLRLGMWESWWNLWTVFPTDEDIEYYDQWSDESEELDHWRDHPAAASFEFEFTDEDMPRPYNEWVPEEVFEMLYDWRVDEYFVQKRYAAQARALLQQYSIRLVDEPALSDVFEGAW